MNGQIIVGWTDSPEGHSALDWAVHQALLTNRSVVVVHEMLQDSLGGGAGEQGGSRMLVKEKSKVDAAVHAVAERFRDLDLQIAVEVDAPSAGLLRWSSAADVLVVGAPSRLHPRMLGSLPEHLAAAAESPVAWISAGWQPSSNTNRTVVVGAMPTPAGRAAVRFAASEAIRMSAVLIAVVGSSRLSADGQAMLAHFDELAIAEPELTIEVDWIDADPAEALVGLSRRSQLLVVGTHHSSDRWSIRLGPITEEVLRRAHCPVITVARVHVSTAPTIVEPGKSSV
ncbi:universal stress protein [Nakamurella sp. PAMC28650]|uniref:universal stress protein n=1 Tax=Nakamurella sp. PAMC28650 TaxID=2762325 RepID=UPI00164DDC22|nr:universal stress protein [Nakamurella sp. PAMC28650]QNK80332.1 universal stress protein [Nakamurella sp. PAMC28650]